MNNLKITTHYGCNVITVYEYYLNPLKSWKENIKAERQFNSKGELIAEHNYKTN